MMVDDAMMINVNTTTIYLHFIVHEPASYSNISHGRSRPLSHQQANILCSVAVVS
jgi:hypothetical protein